VGGWGWVSDAGGAAVMQCKNQDSTGADSARASS
jgi:hypothetical protein